MGRRISAASDGDAVRELRDSLIRRAEESLVALDGTCDFYDFSAERDRLLDRLDDLKAGRPVGAYAWEIPRHMLPGDRRTYYTVTTTGIVPAAVTVTTIG